jgi:cell division protein FtsN
VSPERDEPIGEQDPELYEDIPPRSIFAATWFRVVLVVIVVGVGGAVAVPYVLDWMNPPPSPEATGPASPLVPAPVTSGFDRPAEDRPASDAKDSPRLIPVPLASAPAARAEAEARPSPVPPAKPVEPASRTAAPADQPAAADRPAQQTAAVTTERVPRPAAPPRPATAARPGPARRTVAKATPPATPAATGPFWVQVGAFKDVEAARRLASKLREDNFEVQESLTRKSASAGPAPKAPPAVSGSDHYDVFVSGMSADELNTRLAGKGLSAEPSGNRVRVKPSLPLRDAVALSKDLASDGLKVQVRRAGAAAVAAAAPAPASAAEAGTAMHRVRVGSFSDRTAALAAVRELEAKGFKPFIARGDQ